VNFAKLCRVATRSGSSWLTTTRFCTKALLRCSPASTPSPPSVRSSRIARACSGTDNELRRWPRPRAGVRSGPEREGRSDRGS